MIENRKKNASLYDSGPFLLCVNGCNTLKGGVGGDDANTTPEKIDSKG